MVFTEVVASEGRDQWTDVNQGGGGGAHHKKHHDDDEDTDSDEEEEEDVNLKRPPREESKTPLIQEEEKVGPQYPSDDDALAAGGRGSSFAKKKIPKVKMIEFSLSSEEEQASRAVTTSVKKVREADYDDVKFQFDITSKEESKTML